MKLRKTAIFILCGVLILLGSICSAKNEDEIVVNKNVFITAQVINSINNNLELKYLYDLSRSIIELTEKYQVPKEVVLAVIAQESDFNPKSYNRSGATGLGQIIPSIWCPKFNIKKQDLWNWETNLEVTIRVIDRMRMDYGHKQDWIGYYYTAAPGPRRWYYGSVKKRIERISFLFEEYEKDFNLLVEVDG